MVRIDLIVKTHKERFLSYHCFRSQHIYYIAIAVCSYEHGAEKILSLSNIQQMETIQQWRAVYPYVHAIHLWHRCWQSAAQLRLWSALLRWWCYNYYNNLRNHCGGRSSCNYSDDFTS